MLLQNYLKWWKLKLHTYVVQNGLNNYNIIRVTLIPNFMDTYFKYQELLLNASTSTDTDNESTPHCAIKIYH